MKQYTDYIREQHDRAERIKQQFPHEPIKSKKPSIWMHTGIDRYESPNELVNVVIFCAFSILIVIAVLIWS